MTALDRALHTVVMELDAARIPYMVIGGVANLVWGVPRATFGVDLAVWVEPAGEKGAVKRLSGAFKALPKDPCEFMQETRVLPIDVYGTKVDVIFGQLPYEKQAVERARTVEFGGHRIKVCTPEDLVVQKIIAERPKDEEDLKGLAKCVGAKLDRTYLDPLVRSLAVQLERPDLWARYERIFP